MLKTFGLFIISFFSSLMVWAQEPADTVKTPDGHISYITTYKGKFKTVVKYHKKQYKVSRITYLDRKMYGDYITYYPNGKVRVKCKYKFDLLVGKAEEFYDNGQLKELSEYRIVRGDLGLKSALQGKQIKYYNNGHISHIIHYTKGVKDGILETYDQKGGLTSKTTYKQGYKSGESIEYYKDGKVKSSCNVYESYLVNGILYPLYYKGKSMYYYENGNLQAEIQYENGDIKSRKQFRENGQMLAYTVYEGEKRNIRHYTSYDEIGVVNCKYSEKIIDLKETKQSYFRYHGLYERFEAGQLLESYIFVDGEKEGEFKTYHKNGVLNTSGTYKNGKYVGFYKSYFDNGVLASESYYKEIESTDKSYRILKDGWHKTYDRKGQLASSTYYYKGKKLYTSALKNTRVEFIKHDVEGVELYTEFYKDGKPLSLSFRLGGYGIYEYFLINGKNRYLKQYFGGRNHFSKEMDFDSNGNLIKFTEKNKQKLYSDETFDEWLTETKACSLFDYNFNNGIIEIKNKLGNTKVKFGIKNMLIDGDFFYYHPNGNILFKAHYNKGIPEGESYTIDMNGDTIMFKRYHNGEAIFTNIVETTGIRHLNWYNDLRQNTKSIIYFENGNMNSYYEKERDIYRTYNREGVLVSSKEPSPTNPELILEQKFYDNGTPKIMFTRSKKDHRLFGVAKEYYENGQLKKVSERNQSGLHGEMISYRDNGEIVNKGTYINNKKEGLWIETKYGVKKEVLYKNNIGQVKSIYDKCYCLDTTFIANITAPIRLLDLVDYETYTKMHIDIVKPFKQEEYENIYIKNFHVNEVSTRLDLLFIKTIKLKLKGKGNTYITLNPCFTEGYINKRHAYYNASPRHLENRMLELNDMTITVELDLARIKTLPIKALSFRLKTEKLLFSEYNGLQMKPYLVESCFNPIYIGPLEIIRAKSVFLNETKETKTNNNTPSDAPFPFKGKKDVDYGVFGIGLKDASGIMYIDGHEVNFEKGKINFTEQYISGYFTLPLYTFYKEDIHLLNTKNEVFKATLKDLNSLFEGPEFTKTEIGILEGDKKLYIKFIITE